MLGLRCRPSCLFSLVTLSAHLQERIPVLQLVKEIASIMQEFTQSGGVRPFGVSLLIAGFDEEGAQLYQVCAWILVPYLLCSHPNVMDVSPR